MPTNPSPSPPTTSDNAVAKTVKVVEPAKETPKTESLSTSGTSGKDSSNTEKSPLSRRTKHVLKSDKPVVYRK